MRLREFADDQQNHTAQSLLALSALLNRQIKTADAKPKISIDAFIELAKNVGIRNLDRRNLIDLSGRLPLKNIISKIEGDEVYFVDDSGTADRDGVEDPQRQAALNAATVDKMAGRQAKKALKK